MVTAADIPLQGGIGRGKTMFSHFAGLLGRLPGYGAIGWRLSVGILVLMAPLTMLVYTYSQSRFEMIETARIKRACIEYVDSLHQFARHLAEHRGLSNLYLHGDLAVLPL